MTSHDDFGDRMKFYEGLTNTPLMPKLPVCARLDGRTFHTFTRHAERPFSAFFHHVMVELTKFLVVESRADVAYTQSDEITLAWLGERPSAVFFDGNVQKMISTLAAMASVHLGTFGWSLTGGDTMADVRIVRESKSGLAWHRAPTFDCRVWQVPSEAELSNVFLWRQQDACRNSVQMAARHHLGHAACNDKKQKELQEALFAAKGINWNDYPPWAKRGIFVQHQKTSRPFSAAEIEALPPKHHARSNPDLLVERRTLAEADIDLRALPSLGARSEALFGPSLTWRYEVPAKESA